MRLTSLPMHEPNQPARYTPMHVPQQSAYPCVLPTGRPTPAYLPPLSRPTHACACASPAIHVSHHSTIPHPSPVHHDKAVRAQHLAVKFLQGAYLHPQLLALLPPSVQIGESWHGGCARGICMAKHGACGKEREGNRGRTAPSCGQRPAAE